MYLDNDHRERENVRFLAMCSPCQDLWRSPSRGVAVMTRGARYGIQILGDGSEAEIRDACMTKVIHKDIWLPVVRSQRGVKQD